MHQDRKVTRARELSLFLAPLVVGSVAVWGCTGRLGDSGAIGQEPTSEAQACVAAGPETPLRRLTRWEYNNTVRDLLGDTSAPADDFVPEAEQFGFDNNAAGATLNALVIEQFEAAANIVGEAAVADLPSLLGCDPASEGEDVCATQFIESFGRRAFRRPLEEGEKERFFAFYQASAPTYGYDGAIGMIVKAVLQSPNFLYRIEIGLPDPASPDAVPLSSYEVASRLSYLLWGSMPDAELLDAADRGELSTPEQVRAHAQRMLDDDKGAQSIKNFYAQWADLGGLEHLDRPGTDYTPEVAALMREETETFADEVIRKGDGTFRTFLTAPYSYMSEPLASYYGVDGASGGDFSQVDLDPERYGGVMTQGSLMALLAHPGQPSPVLRGKFIREQILCTPPPEPPNDVDTTLPDVDPNATAREQLEELTGVDPCLSCHAFINPPGFAFEYFDELGRVRETDHGLPIDASGELTSTDVDGSFADNTELMAMLADSEQARSCLIVHWFRYAYGRDSEEGDACSLDDLEVVFSETDGNVKELLLQLTQTPAFLYRTKIAGGAP